MRKAEMRALTVKQPWAGAIFSRGKNIENRSWSTHYRGPLLIHAGARFDREAIEMIRPALGEEWGRGRIIGCVDLVDCVRGHRSKWADKGSWHWILKNARALKSPVIAKGKLGLWIPDDSILSIIRRQLR